MATLTLSEGSTYDPSVPPPAFGHALKKYWAFDEGYVNLNNGAYGSQPLPVFAESQKIQLLSEQAPDEFHRRLYLPLLDEARANVAKLLGAKVDEVVFVTNTSHGVGTVLRNIEWREGDVILGASITYQAVANGIRYLGDRSEQPRPQPYFVELRLPMTHQELIDAFRAKIREIKQLHPETEFTYTPGSEGQGNRFVVVIDAIVSLPGVALPWKRLVKMCAEDGLWSVIDAAHSIGQEVNINLSEARPDFWISNCHKWLYTKRSCAVLYVPERNQHIIKSSIPTAHAYGSATATSREGKPVPSFVAQHEWSATVDFSPFLSTTHALKFREWLGGEAKINSYCHDLAVRGGTRLADILGTKVLDESGELTLNMTNVMLPLPVDVTGKPSVYNAQNMATIQATVQQKQLFEWNVAASLLFHAGAWWVRASAQVWTEISDFEYLGKALAQICEEIIEDIPELKKVDA
ncbi:hypothetical protein EIP91_002939 [Steccherinum ochraceum]|uniref:Aminotransferase class I/classII large domain-containing protein n=1 Tax=Steccherinum ochraceum TaxID=92696 RepID=A0A4R0RBA6_9APHY|nr:hypothetical protein EIP91_002939 [Steccherinum ochraceum]